MNSKTGAAARFGAAAMIALGISLTTSAVAQDYTICPAKAPARSDAAREARAACLKSAEQAYLQWAVSRHRAALGRTYLTAQNPVAPRDARARDAAGCACGTLLHP
jgi:hypothetical protein